MESCSVPITFASSQSWPCWHPCRSCCCGRNGAARTGPKANAKPSTSTFTTKALERSDTMRTCTNGKWGVSFETGSDRPGVKLNVYRHFKRPCRRTGLRWTSLYGQLDGTMYETQDDACAAAL